MAWSLRWRWWWMASVRRGTLVVRNFYWDILLWFSVQSCSEWATVFQILRACGVMIERGSNWHLRDRLDRQRARSRHWSWWWMRNGRGGGSIVVNTCREFLWFSIQSCSEWVTVLHFCGGLLCVVVMVGAGKELKRTASFESAILSQNGRR